MAPRPFSCRKEGSGATRARLNGEAPQVGHLTDHIKRGDPDRRRTLTREIIQLTAKVHKYRFDQSLLQAKSSEKDPAPPAAGRPEPRREYSLNDVEPERAGDLEPIDSPGGSSLALWSDSISSFMCSGYCGLGVHSWTDEERTM